MPAAGAWLAAVWTGGGVGAFVLKTAVSMAINFGVSKLTQPKGPSPQELQTEARSSSPQRVRHLGRVRTSGTIVFYDWRNLPMPPDADWVDLIQWSLGKRRLYKLLAVAEGGMTNVVQWYLDGEPVSVDATGRVTTAPWNKAIVRLQFRKGIQGDQWDGGDYEELRAAFPDSWTVDHRLRGVGTILATFDAVSGEDIAEVYSGGEPEVSALIDGAPAYWAFANDYSHGRTPAHHLSDVLAHPIYGNLSAADLDLPKFQQARVACATPVPTAGGERPRYFSGISLSLSDAMKDNAQKLLDAMGGRAWLTAEGKLAVEAGVWIDPVVTIEERHIAEMDYGAGTERISRITTLVPSYVSPEQRWQQTTADPVEDAAAIAKWGEGQPKGTDLLAVQHHGQAAHLGRQQLARLNPDRRMTVKLRAFGLRLVGEIRCAVNIPRLGLTQTPFWIDSLSFDGTNFVAELIEANPAAIADNTVDQEGTPPAEAPDPVENGPAREEVTIDDVTVVTNDGPPYIRISGSMAGGSGSTLIAQYRRSSSSTWTEMIEELVPGDGYQFRTPALGDLVEYDVRVLFGWWRTLGARRDLVITSTPVVVSAIDVVVNNEPPAAPVVVSASGAAGGTLEVTFMPDLGANYVRTGLYRAPAGDPFSSATFLKWSYDTSADVTMTAAVPAAGARFWLRSENRSERRSPEVEVGNYPA